MTRVRNKSQLHMDDKVIEDSELSQMLEDREEAKAGVKAYREIDKKVKAKIESMDVQPPYRIDRFIITKSNVPSRSVSFDTNPSTRISIKLAGD